MARATVVLLLICTCSLVWCQDGSPSFANCAAMLEGKYNVYWTLDQAGGSITLSVEASVPANKNSYIGLGFQPATVRDVKMVGADAVISGLHNGSPNGFIYDYTLQSQDPCSSGATTFGVCQDATYGGKNDVTAISLVKTNNIIRSTFRRKLITGDSLDVDLSKLLNQTSMVIFSTGPLDSTSTDAAPKPNEHINSLGYMNGGRFLSLGAAPGTYTCTPLLTAAAGATTPSTPVPTAAASNSLASGAAGGCSVVFKGATRSFSICRDLGAGFTLRWSLDANGVLNGTISKATTGWLGFGINPSAPQMIGSSALVAVPLSTGITVQQYFLRAQESSAVKPGGVLSVLNTEAEFVSGIMTLAFSIQLKAEQINGGTNIVWAAGGSASDANDLTEHSDKDSGTVDLKAGSVSIVESGSTRKVHGSLGAIAFGFLMPLGVLIARFFKSKAPLWFYLHIAVQSTAYVLGVISLILGLTLETSETNTLYAHAVIGWIIVLGATLQVLALILRPHVGTKPRRVWNHYHWWVGRGVLFLAVIQIYLGLKLIKAVAGLYILYSLVLAALIASFLGLELWTRLRPQKPTEARMSLDHQGSKVNLNGAVARGPEAL